MAGFTRFFRVAIGLACFLILASSVRAQFGDKEKTSRELRTLLADIDDLRLPGFSKLSSAQQKLRLQSLRKAEQNFVPLGFEKKLWVGYEEHIDLQLKLLGALPKDAAIDAKSWQNLAVDLWQNLAQIVGLDFVPAGTPSYQKGEETFGQHCSECHGKGGDGTGVLTARLPVSATRFDAKRDLPNDTTIRFFTHISVGRKERAMPAFENILTPEEIWSLAFYVQSIRFDCGEKNNQAQDFFRKHEAEFLPAFSLRQLVFESDSWLLAKTRRLGYSDDQRSSYILHCILPFFAKIKRY